jgi:hypothetical protein
MPPSSSSSSLDPLPSAVPASVVLPASVGLDVLEVSRALDDAEESDGELDESGGACVVASEARNVFVGSSDASGLAASNGEYVSSGLPLSGAEVEGENASVGLPVSDGVPVSEGLPVSVVLPVSVPLPPSDVGLVVSLVVVVSEGSVVGLVVSLGLVVLDVSGVEVSGLEAE